MSNRNESEKALRTWEAKFFPRASGMGQEWQEYLGKLRAEVLAGERDVEIARQRLNNARFGMEAASNQYKAHLKEAEVYPEGEDLFNREQLERNSGKKGY